MEDKKGYTEQLEALLMADDRSEVISCKYDKKPGLESVEIVYKGGYTVRINVTANSLGAILKEVAKEVYSNGAIGTFSRGFPQDEEVPV